MSKKMVKIMSVVLMALMIISVATSVFAGDLLDPSTIQPKSDTSATGKIQTILGNVLGIAQVIGIGVAVIMLIVLAIKYISAAPGDKAEIKKHAVVYIVGAVVLFAASGILGIIKEFAGMVN